MTNNDVPFDFSWGPQGKLRRLVRVLIEARISYTEEMAIIRLPLN
jgi:hypothetical protein